MKTRTIHLLLIFILFSFSSISQVDTLSSIYEFIPPSQNPWGLVSDGDNFWISDENNGKIYKTDYVGNALDSIILSGTQIKGIEINGDTIWALNSLIVGDTIINDSNFPLFSLYQIDKSSGQIYDTIKIISPYTNIQSGDLWGLCLNSSFFYISFNGGYGPCLIKIDPVNNTQEDLCCTHFTGMTSINDSLWAINLENNLVSSNGYDEYIKYIITINTLGLTYDGTHFWVVGDNTKKIHKLESTALSISDKMIIRSSINISPNPATNTINIVDNYAQTERIELLNVRGQIINSFQINKHQKNYNLSLNKINSGVYFFKFYTINGTLTKKILIK